MLGSSRLGFIMLSALLPIVAQAAGISSIFDAPQVLNGKTITVRGTVVNFHENPSLPVASVTFSLCGGGCVRVYAAGRPKLSNGQSITVTGTFSMVDHINGYVYYNQIDATELSIHGAPPAVPTPAQ